MARAEGERTPEQRAAAAAERAARRAARDGGSAAPPPPETFAAGLRPASLDGDGDGHEPAPEPAEPVAARAASELEAPEPVIEPQPEPEPAREAELEPPPDPSEPGRRRVRHQVASDRRRRVSAMAARTPARPSRLSASGRPQPPRRPARATGGHARRRIAALIALVVIALALYLIHAIFQPFHGSGTGSVSVSIPSGADAGKIGDLLAERGVVDSGTFFQLNATLTGRRGGLRPGDYTLRHGMSYGGAIDALTQGPKARVVKTINVTVPEGLSMREAAPLVDKGPLVGSYLKAARSLRTLQRARKLGAPRRVRTAEGFLFPATYTLVDGAPARNLVDRQLAAFSENMAKVDMSYAKHKNLTRYDVLTIASMVERETQSDKERPLIASVIYNRLKQGIPLGIDATIRYFENDWSRPLRESELQRDDPYNTRLNRGLPPTPIGNPGLASLKAAAHPATTNYIFYVAKPGTCGHAFSSSDAGFQRDVARYNAARAKAGGKSPTTC